MRAVLLSQYFPPETIEYAHDLARHLVDEGHRVRVVTAYPNWPTGEFHQGYDPQSVTTENVDGIDVVRVPVRAGNLASSAGRIGNYLSFALSSLRATREIRDADVAYVYATPMTAGTAALIWRLLGKLPFVLHVQDVWPESVTESRFLTGSSHGAALAKRTLHGILGAQSRLYYKLASRIVVIAPSMNRLLSSRGAHPGKLVTLFNWAEEASVPRADPDHTARRTFLYAGNLGGFQDLETVIAAFNDQPDDLDHELLIAGSGTEEAKLRTLAATNPRIRFLGRLGQDELAEHYRRAHFHLVTLKNLPIFEGTIPSKFQSAMCSGTPVVTTVPGDLRSIVETNRVGLTADAEDRTSLSRALRMAIEMEASEVAELASNARTFYETSMSRAQGVRTLERLLQAAVDGGVAKETRP